MWRMKRHRTLGITWSFCDLFVWGERNMSSKCSSGKFPHRAQPETNFWHPCQCFKTKEKAHSRILTVPDWFALQPREPAYSTYESGMKWQKSKLWGIALADLFRLHFWLVKFDLFFFFFFASHTVDFASSSLIRTWPASQGPKKNFFTLGKFFLRFCEKKGDVLVRKGLKNTPVGDARLEEYLQV